MSEGYFYLATPYSHPDPEVMALRHNMAADFVVLTMNYNIVCYSPIMHSHWLAVNGGYPTNHEFWHEHNCQMIKASKAVIVLRMEGWEQSKGIKAEIEYAHSIQKPVYFGDVGEPNFGVR